MSKCESCIHFEYHAAIEPSLAKLCGIKTFYTEPTCICNSAGQKWKRTTAEIKKPRGMKCEYERKMGGND